MKLLGHKDTQAKLAEEKKREIDNAVKFARKTDELRERVFEEETKLKAYREEILPAVLKEIADAITERDAIRKECDEAQQELRETRRPLDQEWIRVSEEAEKNEERAAQLDVLEDNLGILSSQLRNREMFIGTEEDRISLEREQSKTLLSEATIDRKAAKDTLDKARNEAQVTLSYAELRQKEADRRIGEVEIREIDLVNSEAHLKRRETALLNRERQVEDRYNTLLRTEKRHGNQHRSDTRL